MPLPAGTVRAVRDLVGPEAAPAFTGAAAERELAARTMDALAADGGAENRRPPPR
ncbi:hypothetical protein [Streptomyces sp. 8N616]|uniref:hypothetical protein n=1 Tax=Streptomyces sp. 8N616 TaxID=3457414 RepID=UPI003FD43795